MKLILLIASLYFVTISAESEDSISSGGKVVGSQRVDHTIANPSGLMANPDELIGTWELVEQKGYGPSHPDDVEQTLTFHDDGGMINEQSSGGRSTMMVLNYRVEGDRIVATIRSVEIDGELLNMEAGGVEQTFLWKIENAQLVISYEKLEMQDIYRRAD